MSVQTSVEKQKTDEGSAKRNTERLSVTASEKQGKKESQAASSGEKTSLKKEETLLNTVGKETCASQSKYPSCDPPPEIQMNFSRLLKEILVDPDSKKVEWIRENMAEDKYRSSFFEDAQSLPEISAESQFLPVPAKCSGDPTSFETVMCLLQSMFKDHGVDLRFFDSSKGAKVKATDLTTALALSRKGEKPSLILRLLSTKGLDQPDPPLPSGVDENLCMATAHLYGVPHPTLQDVKTRLACVHGVAPTDVCIVSVFEGSTCIEYTVNNLRPDQLFRGMQNGMIVAQMRQRFDQFAQLNIHPLFFGCNLDISLFDQKEDKTPAQWATRTFSLGPSDLKAAYAPPTGYMRFGLKVLDMQVRGQLMAAPLFAVVSQTKLCWRAFHGTKRAAAGALPAMDSIVRGGFLPSVGGLHGAGVYCSPEWGFVQRWYAPTGTLDTVRGPKTFEWMFQVAVRPDRQHQASNSIWRVRDPHDIRPYGLLVRELP
uniref:Uncharacterized protein n=1 Tax=Chromera velia CCMP2878 TaxID=1169474 RepID=A0A0G4GNX0_9ALVE|eukprot:Cvel_22731.t1-p1 / transcript=Cvel_22731.t1 / gene=Cvel_22731 / organism=Chromera_velia_CCMP2878 / gene_product=hypothetical protein / transcript_product=hypothetical protein / location=Cvel_scaffold2267:1014-2692(+) / protein_length=484 / sequence_SO=supercontig / SO=protein_coding / is_pseudo=false